MHCAKITQRSHASHYSHYSHTSCLALAACLLWALTAPTALCESDSGLLLNPGFEEGNEEGVTDWEFYADSEKVESSGGVATTGAAKQDLEIFKEGVASLLVENEGPRWAGVKQEVILELGTTYKLTAWAKTRATHQSEATVNFSARSSSGGQRDAEGKPIRPLEAGGNVAVPSDGEWHEVSFDYTVPPDLPQGRPKVNLTLKIIPKNNTNLPIQVWFDDLRLEQIEEPAQ